MPQHPTAKNLPGQLLIGRIWIALAVLLLLSGCQSYDQQTTQFTSATKAGSFAAAVIQIDKQAAKSAGSKDELVYRLEQGATLHAAALAEPTMVPDIRPPVAPAKTGEAPVAPLPEPTPTEVHRYYLTRSIAAFDRAEAMVPNSWDEQTKQVKVSSEIGAALTNQANLPYSGRDYDKIMMNTYKALSYLGLGDKDKARVELNRAEMRRKDAVAANEKRIVTLQDEQEKARKGELKDETGKSAAYDSAKALEDPKTGSGLQATYEASTALIKPYGDYENPFTLFVSGLFLTVLGEGSDFEQGRNYFERVASMVPENNFVRADLDTATQAAKSHKAPSGITYVIFETGRAPSRDQVRVDIPTFLVTSKLAYVGASFPKLKFNSDYIPSLGVTAGESTVQTSTVASMDSVIATDFKNEWPSIVTKTIITTATKAIIQAVVQKAVEDRARGGWGALAGLVMTGINSSTNIADTRTWTSLPKEFQYARVATPANRELKLEAGGVQKTVVLEPGLVNVVYVKSTSTTAPLLVSTFVLR